MNVQVADNHKPQTGTQPLGGTDIPYLFYGGDGPPLIFLHATGFIPWLWHPLARDLADRYRIFSPSFCDHRQSDPEKGGVSWISLAEDLALFCRNLHLVNPFLVGHSMGATVALMAHTLYDLSAAGMVLIEPIILPQELYRQRPGLEQHPFASRAIRRTNFWLGRDEAMAYLRSRSLFQGWDEEMLALYLEHGMSAEGGGLKLTCSPRNEAALFMGSTAYDPWSLLPRVSCPSLILEGEKSEQREFLDLERVCSLIPDCVRNLVGDAGHLIPMEKPREVASLIRKFFHPLQPEGKEKGAGTAIMEHHTISHAGGHGRAGAR